MLSVNQSINSRDTIIVRVGRDTRIASLGWAIRCFHLENKFVRLSMLGVNAASIALKAVSAANTYLSGHGVQLLILARMCDPSVPVDRQIDAVVSSVLTVTLFELIPVVDERVTLRVPNEK